jgi:nucleobase:cation symporter-1, NCS1 family
MFTAPLTICITALCGLLITSATATLYGEYIWNPFELLIYIQQRSSSPGARAGTFFAGLGFLASQLSLCTILNCISGGMDMAALCPKYINIRRGSIILSIVAVAICPWNYVTYFCTSVSFESAKANQFSSRPTTFITVLSGWAVFLVSAPLILQHLLT